jgi:hypothetical protein
MSKYGFTSKTLFLNYIDLPKHLKENIKDRYEHFSNDICLEFWSEQGPQDDKETFAEVMTMERIEKCWKENLNDPTSWYKDCNTIEKFFEKGGMQMEWWLIENKDKIDLNVNKIIIKVCW